VGFGRRTLAALGKVGIVLAVVVAFLFGMLGTVYLSLRTAEVKVPDVLGKDRFEAERLLEDAGLKIRVRGARASAEKPDTILSQLPESGLTVKTGIEIAVEVSRAPKEGERVSAGAETPTQEAEKKPAENANQSSATNQNQNKPARNKNTNKNANNKNANNSNNSNGSANANRNANNRNANTIRNTNNGNRNATTTPNANRTTNNSNTIRRPAITTPPFNPGANRGTP
jgi:PASTA domain